MELARGTHVESPAGIAEAAGDGEPRGAVIAPQGARIDAEASTALLRRCTALAARARVELLAPSRGTAAGELTALLAQMEGWEAGSLEDPDPIMTVLAAAALQDLVEQLRDPATTGLATSAEAVLRVLRSVMAASRVDVPA